MERFLFRFHVWLNEPIRPVARILLAFAVLPLALAFTEPLWNMHFAAPQYPEGLSLEIYAHTIESGNDGRDLDEINTLNHYIGMRKIDRGELSDLDWIPFAIGGLFILALRVAVIGEIRSLVDLAVLLSYFGVFSLGRFLFKLHSFGHNLDPQAPIRIDGFMPAIVGDKIVGNFTTSAYPGVGSYFLGAFAVAIFGLVIWHALIGWRSLRAGGTGGVRLAAT
jgi:hypothetical protein